MTALLHYSETAKGRAQVHVVENGEVIRTLPWQDNLILDQGMNNIAAANWWQQLAYCVAGTGTTPTIDIMDGTAGQSGTTVTLTGSTYSFSAGDVGKWVGWAGGQQAKITAYISATTVTADRSQTVSTATATLYRAAQTGLAVETKRTNTRPVYTYTDGRQASVTWGTAGPPAVIRLRSTYDFSAEVGSVNYTEIGISPSATVASNLFARILLAGAVTVTSGQQLRVTYELAITISDTNRPTQVLPSSLGWPYTYTIVSIASTGANFTVTLNESHHYVAGGTINIAGAKRPRFTITAAVSTGANFTLTTSGAHGFVSGDLITIEGVSPSGYNGAWTCDTGTTGSTIVVTTVANPGTGTVFGNVRLTEPGTWYNGLWTVASVTSTTVVVTSALNLGAAGADGTVKNDLSTTFYINYWPISPLATSGVGVPASPDVAWNWGSSIFANTSGGSGVYEGGHPWTATFYAALYSNASALTAPGSFPLSATYMPGGTSNANTNTTIQSYVAGNFYRDILAEWNTGAANVGNIRAVVFGAAGSNAAPLVWMFSQMQRKTSTNRLRVTLRASWGRTFI